MLILIKPIRDGRKKRLSNEECEWHAVEHKLINLLESNQELMLENLKKAPMTRLLCGRFNKLLKESSDKKLKEAIMVGHQYLELLEKQTLPSFFELVVYTEPTVYTE